MKAQSVILTHTLLIAISVALIFVVVLTFTNMRSSYQDATISDGLSRVCLSMKAGMEKIYSDTGFLPQNDTLLGSVDLLLPDSISDIKYRTYFLDGTLYASSLDGRSESCKIGLDAMYMGSTGGGDTRIDFMQMGNGTKMFSVEKV